MSRCKDCVTEGVTTVRPVKHPGPRCATHHREFTKDRRVRRHDLRVQAIYGLAEGDYERLYRFQDGRCAGCQRSTGRTRRLAVDHHHGTGEVRGLLCKPCNRMVGWFRDDPATFQRLARYLVDPPARQWRRQLVA